ncbi:peptidase MA family metallohydrolase [bacterium]|nr:peptidase MA family metallohydrolase [bacterium]
MNDILEASYAEHSSQLDYYPPSPITIIVYDKKKEVFSSSLQNPNWAAGVYDGEIRIPGAELDKDPYKLETVIRHELMHLFLDSITRNSIPTWFNEGIAQYFEKPFRYDGDEAFDQREDSPLPKGFKKALSAALKNNKLLDMEVLSGSFMNFSNGQVQLAYAQSLMLTKYFIETFGVWKLQRLLRSLYQGNLFYVAFKKESGMNLNEFLQSWVIYQKKQWKL